MRARVSLDQSPTPMVTQARAVSAPTGGLSFGLGYPHLPASGSVQLIVFAGLNNDPWTHLNLGGFWKAGVGFTPSRVRIRILP
jgi:hypothetical protein